MEGGETAGEVYEDGLIRDRQRVRGKQGRREGRGDKNTRTRTHAAAGAKISSHWIVNATNACMPSCR